MTPASTLDEAFAAAVSRHDARIAALGLSIWVGSEPTFTDPRAQSPEWLTKALGGDKEQRAEALLCEFCQRLPGGLLLRSVGRQYPGEDRPRWNLGLYRRRNGDPVWPGPPDPMLAMPASAALPRPGKAARRLAPADLNRWATALAAGLAARGWLVTPLAVEEPLERRLLMRTDDRRRRPMPLILACGATRSTPAPPRPAVCAMNSPRRAPISSCCTCTSWTECRRRASNCR
jgi:uncharacterized protein (DUF2126 family)